MTPKNQETDEKSTLDMDAILDEVDEVEPSDEVDSDSGESDEEETDDSDIAPDETEEPV